MLITRTGNSEQISPGSEIISINGQSFENVYNNLFSVISAAGFSPSYRNTFLNEYFERCYSLQYDVPIEVEILIKNTKSVVTELALEANSIDRKGRKVYPLTNCERGV